MLRGLKRHKNSSFFKLKCVLLTIHESPFSRSLHFQYVRDFDFEKYALHAKFLKIQHFYNILMISKKYNIEGNVPHLIRPNIVFCKEIFDFSFFLKLSFDL